MPSAPQPKPPAMQLYVRDWLTSTYGWPLELKGFHMDLLCFAWDNGPLPDDPRWRQRVAGVSAAKAVQLWAAISGRWKKTAKGWINPRQERQRRALHEYRAHAQHASSKRWASTEHQSGMASSINRASIEHGVEHQSGMRRASLRGMPKRSTSSSASSSSDQDQPAAQRPVYVPYKVCVAMATKAYAEEPTDDQGAVAERIKTMCAQQGFEYGPDVIGRAMRAAERARTRKRA